MLQRSVRLQQFESNATSFDFITEYLLPYAHKLLALPDKAVEVVVDVVLEAGDNPQCSNVARICIASGNMLRPEDDDDEKGEPQRSRLTPSKILRSGFQAS